jgi:hypothetical protein
MENTLLASSGTLEGIKKLIEQYYFWGAGTCRLREQEKGLWRISKEPDPTLRGELNNNMVIFRKGRYRFVSAQESR